MKEPETGHGRFWPNRQRTLDTTANLFYLRSGTRMAANLRRSQTPAGVYATRGRRRFANARFSPEHQRGEEHFPV